MQIFSTGGIITPNEDKTNIVLDFTVPKGTKKLTVHFSYSPKYLEDEETAAEIVTAGLKKYNVSVVNPSEFLPVANLVTLSFDENRQYRGACHRQPNDQTIVIAETDSTPGIINGAIHSGIWDIVLNIHYAGCNIDYRIDVEGEGEV
ncbi:MAG: hypothetical protein MR398_06595 [Oscillospiraceae bacterium]|nr:hypothetical protein [Oscillospiraceae bacterium]